MRPLMDTVSDHLARDIVGVAVAIVSSGEVTFSAGFGATDVEDPRVPSASTVFPVQSVSKAMVATAVMCLVERGAIDLDEPVNPELGEAQLRNPWEKTSPVTARLLLTHTAGLAEWAGWHSTTSIEDEVASHLAVAAEPGTRMIYANGGYDVLGCLLASVSGEPWPAAVEELVLEPLGMSSTGTGTPPPDLRDVAVGHVRSQLDGTYLRIAAPAWPYDPPPPSGSMYSTVGDLARFLAAHLRDGAGVLSPETLADMHRVHAGLGPGGGGMGLGFRADRRSGRQFICHGGDGVGFTSFIGGYPSEGDGVVVLINTAGAQEARSRIVTSALDSALEPPSKPPTTTVLPAEAVGAYRSTYWGIRGEIELLRGAPVLKVATGSVLSGETETRLSPVGNRWRGEDGMFDGWELDLTSEPDGSWRIYGGAYAFEFVADATPIVRLPRAVEKVSLTGKWKGMADSPFGQLPLEVDVRPAGVTAISWGGGDELPVLEATTTRGWLTGEVDIDVPGIGPMKLFLRLGSVSGRLEGMLYARGQVGEFAVPTLLARGGGP